MSNEPSIIQNINPPQSPPPQTTNPVELPQPEPDTDLLNIDEFGEDDATEIADDELEEEISEIESIPQQNLETISGLIQETKEAKLDGVVEVNFSRTPAEREFAYNSEIIDDFIRNFFIRHKLHKSLDSFQQEWYEAAQKGQIDIKSLTPIPKIYLENQKLEEEAEELEKKLEEARLTAEKAKSTWDKLRRQKEHHKMHHHRIQQEKQKLNELIEKKKTQHTLNEQLYQELSTKYEAAMKEKMVLKMQRDKLSSEQKALTKTIDGLRSKFKEEIGAEEENKPAVTQKKQKNTRDRHASTRKKLKKFTVIPPAVENPHFGQSEESAYEPFPAKNLNPIKSFQGHMLPLSSIAVHPKKPFLVTASDDLTWKIWKLPDVELLASGEGHKDWISDVAFSPEGSLIASSSGDSTVKIFDLVRFQYVSTFRDHIHPVWSVDFHHTGDFLITGAMDHSSKLFDIPAQRSRLTFRGHVDSVNKVQFLPYTNIFATASADKSLSLWDIRTGLCVKTFYGHENSVNSLDVDCRAESIASCDADGIVKIWDLRMAEERAAIQTGDYSANDVAWDLSGKTLAVACDDCVIRMIKDDEEPTLEAKLAGHKDSVQAVAFDHNSRSLISGGSDCEFRIWSQ